MIYLDNAATSFPKPESVYTEINQCMREYCANPGRGGHSLSVAAGRMVMEAREELGSLFHVENPLQLCYTKNATEALNIAIKGSLSKGGHAITTSMEHNSVLRPLMTMKRDRGVELDIIQGNSIGEIDPGAIRKSIRPDTRLIVCTLSSNVNGMVMPVKEIGRMAREAGIPFLVDASQGAGSMELDVEELKADFLAFPGHKGLMGPQGTGGLYVREGLPATTLMEGGTGSNSESTFQPEMMPDYLESGTLNTPGIAGLFAGVRFIRAKGAENIGRYKSMLVEQLLDGISRIDGIVVYSARESHRNSGIVALNIQGMDSTELSFLLDKQYGIATRAGLHCAPLAHRTLGTEMQGIVRFSIGCFNTCEEIDRTIEAIREIVKKFG